MVAEFGYFIAGNIPMLAGIAVAAVMGMLGERWRAKQVRAGWQTRRGARRWRPARRGGGTVVPIAKAEAPTFDYAVQMKAVQAARFSRRALLNASEKRLFDYIEKALTEARPGWRLMAQVNLGEILASPDEEAFRAINTKRVDMLVICERSLPRCAIEYQGKGHDGPTSLERDAIKERALNKAGVGYEEVFAGDTPAKVRELVGRIGVNLGVK